RLRSVEQPLELGRGVAHHPHGIRVGRDLYTVGDAGAAALEGILRANPRASLSPDRRPVAGAHDGRLRISVRGDARKTGRSHREAEPSGPGEAVSPVRPGPGNLGPARAPKRR